MTLQRKAEDQRYPYLYYLWITIVLAILFAFLEPEATQGIPYLQRQIQWLFQVGIALVILINIHVFLQRMVWFNRLNSWVKLTVSGLLGGIIFTPIDVAIDVFLGLDVWPAGNGLTQQLSFLLVEMLSIAPPILLVWVAINTPRVMQLNFSRPDPVKENVKYKAAEESLSTEDRTTLQPAVDINANEEPQIFSQLPAHLGKDVIYLKSELHYLQVVTLLGESLILFNLRDAINQINTITPGVQTHRSYWVAEKRVIDLIRKNGKTFLKTEGEHLVPVSRRNVSNIKLHFSKILKK